MPQSTPSEEQVGEISGTRISAQQTSTVPNGTQLPDAFISPSTVMSLDALDEAQQTPKDHTHAVDVKSSILNLTKADILPRPALAQALTDNYFNHVHPFIPIVEEDDLYGPKPSLLLQQAVCLAGSLMQHDPASMRFCRSQYDKVKTLIHLNHESDNVAVLKSLCLLTCYSPLPTDRVTLDGPWQWLGMAIRLAVQMGLHKASTYERHADPRCLRRIFWQLVVRLYSSYYKRQAKLTDCLAL
jgi:hypothetical protein